MLQKSDIENKLKHIIPLDLYLQSIHLCDSPKIKEIWGNQLTEFKQVLHENNTQNMNFISHIHKILLKTIGKTPQNYQSACHKDCDKTVSESDWANI